MGREPYKSPRQQALELSAQRDAISAEMHGITQALEAPGAAGVKGLLVDAEGFPRADVDVHTVRAQRHRLAVLETDYKNLTKQLEVALQAALPPSNDNDDADMQTYSAPAPAASGSSANPPADNGEDENEANADANETPSVVQGSTMDRLRVPFAVVDSMAPNSPASEAGVKVGDRIVVFGGVSLRSTPTIANAMRALGAAVREHNGRAVDVIVHRGGVSGTSDTGEETPFSCVVLKMTPKPWGGTGLLGCHVIPAPRVDEDAQYRPDVAVAVAPR